MSAAAEHPALTAFPGLSARAAPSSRPPPSPWALPSLKEQRVSFPKSSPSGLPKSPLLGLRGTRPTGAQLGEPRLRGTWATGGKGLVHPAVACEGRDGSAAAPLPQAGVWDSNADQPCLGAPALPWSWLFPPASAQVQAEAAERPAASKAFVAVAGDA